MRRSLLTLAVAGLLWQPLPVYTGGERILSGYRSPEPRRGRSGNMPPAKRLMRAAQQRRKGGAK